MSQIGLSRRAGSLKPSSTLAVAQRARQMKEAGEDVLAFAAGEPDFVTPEIIRKAAKDALDKGMTHYAPTLGTPGARAAVARKLGSENGIEGLTPKHVAIGVGGKQCLYNVFQALLNEGDEVLLPVPAWVSYAPQIQLSGGKVVELPTDAASGFKITPEQLKAAITPRSRALVINSPSNPCGTMYAPDELRALARVVADAAGSVAPNLVVVTDEIYEKILYGGRTHLSPGSIPEIAERTVTVNGLSKAYAMTGWRIGYAACPGEFGLELIGAMDKIQSQMTSGIATFLMPAIEVALSGECDAEVAKMTEAFAKRAKLIESRMREIPGLEFPSPEGAFYVFADVSAHFGKKAPDGTQISSALSFAEALLANQKMAVVPGEDFGGCGDKCIRISFACSEDQINAGIDRLDALVRSLS